MPSNSRPPLYLLLSVAVLSAAVLGFEVALTRVFAVLLRYHFAFLVISIAVCGLGVGGYAAFWLRRRRELSLPLTATLFALSIALALAAMLRGLFAHFPEAYWLAAVLVLIPFSCAGAFLAEAFARFPAYSGRLYAWDLGGAALAAFALVGMLQLVSAIDACLLMAALGALAGLLAAQPGVSESGSSRRHTNISVIVLLGLMVCFALNSRQHFLDIPAIPPRPDAEGMSVADKNMTQPLFTELGTPGHRSRIIETRWSAFARTDVVQDDALQGGLYLYTNGNVPTNMMQWDGQVSSILPIARTFPLSDWAFDIAPLGRKDGAQGDVLSIGPGGGLDALLALYHGAARFDGAEINPSIVRLMNEPQYAKYNGGVYQRPDVNVRVADGRAFVRESVAQKKKYSLLFSALTKTATAAQGMALLESFIYTNDAFSDYLDVLGDDGQMTIVLDHPLITARFFATALQVLKDRGISEKAAMEQIAIIYAPQPGQPYVYALVVQKRAFTRPQTFELEEKARARGLRPVWIPHQSARHDFGPYPQIAAGTMDLDGFIAWFLEPDNIGGVDAPLIDVSPCPDDRPFVLDISQGTLPVFKQLAAFALVLALGLLAVSWRSSRSDVRGAKKEEIGNAASILDPQSFIYILYFLALGLGFMLVEIPLAQKLILPLGYPTLALTIILFSVLLGGGAGSWYSQRFEDDKLRAWAVGCAFGVAIYTAAATLSLPLLEGALLSMSLPLRCIIVTVMLLPLGFLLGTPFPSGMRLFSAAVGDEKIPLIWGLNGVASVIGSLLAAMGAKNLGFGAMLGVGALIYVMAAILLRASVKKAAES